MTTRICPLPAWRIPARGKQEGSPCAQTAYVYFATRRYGLWFSNKRTPRGKWIWPSRSRTLGPHTDSGEAVMGDEGRRTGPLGEKLDRPSRRVDVKGGCGGGDVFEGEGSTGSHLNSFGGQGVNNDFTTAVGWFRRATPPFRYFRLTRARAPKYKTRVTKATSCPRVVRRARESTGGENRRIIQR